MTDTLECYTPSFQGGIHLDSDESLADWCDQHIALPLHEADLEGGHPS
jgi:hypothetical protein